MGFIEAGEFGFLEKSAEASPVRPSSIPHQGRVHHKSSYGLSPITVTVTSP